MLARASHSKLTAILSGVIALCRPQKKYLKCRHCLLMTFLGTSPLLLSNHISILHYLRIDITQIKKSGTPLRLLSTAVWIGSEVSLLKAVAVWFRSKKGSSFWNSWNSLLVLSTPFFGEWTKALSHWENIIKALWATSVAFKSCPSKLYTQENCF